MTATLTESRALADAYCRGRNTQGGYPCDGLCDSCRSRTSNADYAAVIDHIRLIMHAPTPEESIAAELVSIRDHTARALDDVTWGNRSRAAADWRHDAQCALTAANAQLTSLIDSLRAA